MSDLDNVLRAQELQISTDKEIQRILECCAQDHFSILQFNPLHDSDSLATILKKTYRKKSLLIHPDKTKNPNAPRAFDLLKKAESILSTTADPTDEDSKSRLHEKTSLIEIYQRVAEGLKLPSDIETYDDARNVSIREKVQLVLENQVKDQEIERSYQQRQDVKKQEEIKTATKDRELKKKWESKWEDDRDARVSLWRSFSSKVEKKKKKKKVLA